MAAFLAIFPTRYPTKNEQNLAKIWASLFPRYQYFPVAKTRSASSYHFPQLGPSVALHVPGFTTCVPSWSLVAWRCGYAAAQAPGWTAMLCWQRFGLPALPGSPRFPPGVVDISSHMSMWAWCECLMLGSCGDCGSKHQTSPAFKISRMQGIIREIMNTEEGPVECVWAEMNN